MKFPLVTRMTVPSLDGARAGADAALARSFALTADWMDMLTSQE
ncbi:MAG TPA: hypothetical protein VGF26_23980 [Ramlibacter sp.]